MTGISRTAIVIPFYQREAGVLSRALQSIAQQDYEGPTEIVIVDDASPVSAANEVEDIQLPANQVVTILRQDNGGPGSARNRGLDYATARDFSTVALLDSDDIWESNHLRRAVQAMEQGYDLYLSNWMPIGSEVSAYEERDMASLPLHAIETLTDCQELSGNYMRHEITVGLGKLSTMVLSRRLFSAVRFVSHLRNASEDRLFSYELSTLAPRVLLSRKAEVIAGSGVNIYASKLWGSPGYFKVIEDSRQGWVAAVRIIDENCKANPDSDTECNALLAMVKRRQLENRTAFLGNALHLIRKGRLVAFTHLCKRIWRDPGFVITAGRHLAELRKSK